MSQLVYCAFRFSLPSAVVGKHTGVCSIPFKMDDQFSAVSNHSKQQAVVDFWTDVNNILIEIHQRLLAFYGEDTGEERTVYC